MTAALTNYAKPEVCPVPLPLVLHKVGEGLVNRLPLPLAAVEERYRLGAGLDPDVNLLEFGLEARQPSPEHSEIRHDGAQREDADEKVGPDAGSEAVPEKPVDADGEVEQLGDRPELTRRIVSRW